VRRSRRLFDKCTAHLMVLFVYSSDAGVAKRLTLLTRSIYIRDFDLVDRTSGGTCGLKRLLSWQEYQPGYPRTISGNRAHRSLSIVWNARAFLPAFRRRGMPSKQPHEESFKTMAVWLRNPYQFVVTWSHAIRDIPETPHGKTQPYR